MNNTAWYLVYTKPQKEQLASQQLERQGYTIFLPMARVTKRVRGKRRELLEPFFSRYLFISLNQETDNWSPIRSTIGVSGMVRFGGVAARVPDAIISILQQRQSSEDGALDCQKVGFQRGDAVQITEGPFEGCRAIFSSTRSCDRAFVLLDIVNRHTMMQIDVNALEKIAD
jgi:transcriptional antiterminator RfaH